MKIKFRDAPASRILKIMFNRPLFPHSLWAVLRAVGAAHLQRQPEDPARESQEQPSRSKVCSLSLFGMGRHGWKGWAGKDGWNGWCFINAFV